MEYKLFILDKNTWNYTNSCQQMIIDKLKQMIEKNGIKNKNKK